MFKEDVYFLSSRLISSHGSSVFDLSLNGWFRGGVEKKKLWSKIGK